MLNSSAHLSGDKQLFRDQMRAARRRNPANNPAAFEKLCDIFMREISLPQNAIVSGYCAFDDEMNPAALLEKLRAQGHMIALPVVIAKGQPLVFRRHEIDDQLSISKLGILEPTTNAPVVEPDVMLVPLLAFDAARNRLGYGGGFYDRTITMLRQRKKILAIGTCYANQQLAVVPTELHDVQLDKIVTELKVF